MAQKPKSYRLPAMLLANDLLDGEVVFRTAQGWSPNPMNALLAHNEDAARQLEEAAAQSVLQNEIVDPCLVDVVINADGLPMPNHFRERVKVAGPSVRPDLGKQAVFGLGGRKA